MSAVHTSVVTEAHAYTRAQTPWIIGEGHSVRGRLAYYISGGGMQAFGRTVQQEVARRKHIRFLGLAVLLGCVWLIFLFV